MPSQSALRFGGTSPDYRESLCGRYRIPKITIAGKTRYEVWERIGEKAWRPVKQNFTAYEEALRFAESVALAQRDGVEFRGAKA